MFRTIQPKTLSVAASICLLLLVGGYWCVAEKLSAPVGDGQNVATVVVAAKEGAEPKLVDIGSRHSGHDWPKFLGPTGDSKSTETGIKKNWRSSPLKQLWDLELGTSYGIGTISHGRYFQFDRKDNKCIVLCLNAESGKPIWKFTYQTDYQDLYGYNTVSYTHLTLPTKA